MLYVNTIFANICISHSAWFIFLGQFTTSKLYTTSTNLTFKEYLWGWRRRHRRQDVPWLQGAQNFWAQFFSKWSAGLIVSGWTNKKRYRQRSRKIHELKWLQIMTKTTHDVSFTMCHPIQRKGKWGLFDSFYNLNQRSSCNATFEAVASFLLVGQWLRWFQKLEVF